jgi:hypothetical protein
MLEPIRFGLKVLARSRVFLTNAAPLFGLFPRHFIATLTLWYLRRSESGKSVVRLPSHE